MTRVPDLAPFAPRALAPLQGKAADTLSTSSWFEGNTVGSDSRISADLGIASRGLSVEQHTARVLEHLCAESDERA